MKKALPLIALGAILFAASCKKTEGSFDYYYYTEEQKAILSQYLDLPEIPADYNEPLPTYLQFTTGAFVQPLHTGRVELGRVLFYDKNLSKDQKISCASCHKQELAFGDNNAVSIGVFDRAGERNSIALASVPSFSATYGGGGNGGSFNGTLLFWDNRAKDVQEQSRASLANVKEMDMSMPEVVDAVKNQPYYPVLFTKAFGSTEITEERVTEAIQTFVHSLVSTGSKFDEAAEAQFKQSGQNFTFLDQDFGTFTAQENRGKQIYNNNCASCHSQAVSTPNLSHTSNGLDLNPTDLGVGGITFNPLENGTFKVPSLRNVALTAPFMHDGRFTTLEQVVEHYSSGVKAHENLSPLLKDGSNNPKNLNLSDTEKQDLVAFLKTLSDDKLAVDARFKNPFKQ